MKSKRMIILSVLLVAVMSIGLFAVGCDKNDNNDVKVTDPAANVDTDVNNINDDNQDKDDTDNVDDVDDVDATKAPVEDETPDTTKVETIASGNAKIDVYQAITYAQSEVPDGIVSEVDIDRDEDDGKVTVTYKITVERDGEEFEYKYDEASGKLLEFETDTVPEEYRIDKDAVSITMDQVIEASLRKHDGTIDEIELKRYEDGKFYYKVEFDEDPETEAEVEFKIDAMTGSIEEYVDR